MLSSYKSSRSLSHLLMSSCRSFGGICETVSCPVREMSSPRVGNLRVSVSASCPVTYVHAKVLLTVVTRPVFWPLCPATGRNPARDAGCPSVLWCHPVLGARNIQPEMETRGRYFTLSLELNFWPKVQCAGKWELNLHLKFRNLSGMTSPERTPIAGGDDWVGLGWVEFFGVYRGLIWIQWVLRLCAFISSKSEMEVAALTRTQRCDTEWTC